VTARGETHAGVRARLRSAITRRALSAGRTATGAKEGIGDGLHQRFVVNIARFDAQVQKKVATPT
jgi:predicted thioesterase